MAKPPRVRLPALVQGAAFAIDPMSFLERSRNRYGDVFEVRLPGMGRFVYVTDPALVKQVFAADRDIGLAGEAPSPGGSRSAEGVAAASARTSRCSR